MKSERKKKYDEKTTGHILLFTEEKKANQIFVQHQMPRFNVNIFRIQIIPLLWYGVLTRSVLSLWRLFIATIKLQQRIAF